MKTAFDPLAQRYASQRFPVYACGGMVNCSSPQAAAAGLRILQEGGNAMDAAVAAAAAITVTDPTMNGIGGDAFSLIWSEKGRRLYGLNASGPAPGLASIERVLADGRDCNGKMPLNGWTPVNVPGVPKAWAEITGRFGRLPLSKVLEPAIRYAREGYPCSPNVACLWQGAFEHYRKTLSGECFNAWFDTFAGDRRDKRRCFLSGRSGTADRRMQPQIRRLPSLRGPGRIPGRVGGTDRRGLPGIPGM